MLLNFRRRRSLIIVSVEALYYEVSALLTELVGNDWDQIRVSDFENRLDVVLRAEQVAPRVASHGELDDQTPERPDVGFSPDALSHENLWGHPGQGPADGSFEVGHAQGILEKPGAPKV